MNTVQISSAIIAPEVLESGRKLMPEASSFGEGLWMIIEDIIPILRPDLKEAAGVCGVLIATVMMLSMLRCFSGPVKSIAEISAAVVVAGTLVSSVNSLIQLGAHTITEITEYGKLLIPVMTTALAAQGGIGKSGALYAGTIGFLTLITGIIKSYLIPGVYIFITCAICSSICEESILKKMKDMIKSGIMWVLKTVLSVFVSYIGVTGVVSGTTDAAALKATKTTISTVVPVVGGILSDASEAVLVGISVAKNAAGVYGILAVLAVFLEPFLKMLGHYLLLKMTSLFCSVFDTKHAVDLIEDFTSAMTLMLAMTGAVCMLILIGTVCYMKGVQQ